jgi:cholesterol oxidase
MGVEIHPQTEVTGVRPKNGGYEVLTRKSLRFFRPQQSFLARGVVFSAGVVGTVSLLMKCKQKGFLPKISALLGNYIRTNSESILSVDSKDKNTNWNDQIAITSGVYVDAKTHIEMVRYNKGSDVLFGLLGVLSEGGGRIPRQIRSLLTMVHHPLQVLRALWIPGQAARNTAVLVMQTTENYLQFNYQRRWYRLGGHSMNSEVPSGMERVVSYIPLANEVTRRLAKKMNGYPKSMWTEVLLNAPTTAHILGGCTMAESPDKGVVAFNGEVIGYPNLYVADGSVVPVNLGVYPSLTFTALAVYIMSQMPERSARGWT